MFRSISRLWWLGLLGVIWFGMTGQTQAQMKVRNFRVNFNVEVSSTPPCPRPVAPWYAYFPADPRLIPSPQLSPFPPWPAQFPPPAKAAPKSTGFAPAPPGPMLTRYWPTYYSQGSSLQPVGYVPPQAPSYWYPGR